MKQETTQTVSKSIAGLHTIDINAKEWFDKVNGNSYHSVRIVLNYGQDNEQTILCPFQYGYGNQYEYSAFKALQENGIIKNVSDREVPFRYYQEHGIIERRNIQTGCKKRDVVEWGKS